MNKPNTLGDVPSEQKMSKRDVILLRIAYAIIIALYLWANGLGTTDQVFHTPGF